MRRHQQQQAGLAPLSEEGRRQNLQHLQAQRPMLLPQLSGQLGEACAGSLVLVWSARRCPAQAVSGCILAQWAFHHAEC